MVTASLILMLAHGPTSANFAFLVAHDRLLDHLGALAERYFAEDPSTCLMKLRQFGEVLAQQVAARAGLYTSTVENQAELLGRLRDARPYARRGRGAVPRTPASWERRGPRCTRRLP